MAKKILASFHPPSPELLRIHFHEFIERAKRDGWHELEILFGFAWGGEIHPTNEWSERKYSPDELVGRLEQVEKEGYGFLGEDDLWIKPVGTDLEILFKHENNIEWEAPFGNVLVPAEEKRFLELGWEVYELIYDDETDKWSKDNRPPWRKL